jgi:hypothetical protein
VLEVGFIKKVLLTVYKRFLIGIVPGSTRWSSRAVLFPPVSKPALIGILGIQRCGFDTGLAVAQPYSTTVWDKSFYGMDVYS